MVVRYGTWILSHCGSNKIKLNGFGYSRWPGRMQWEKKPLTLKMKWMNEYGWTSECVILVVAKNVISVWKWLEPKAILIFYYYAFSMCVLWYNHYKLSLISFAGFIFTFFWTNYRVIGGHLYMRQWNQIIKMCAI